MDAQTVGRFLEMNEATLRYWIKSGLLPVAGGGTSGRPYAFSFEDIVRAFAIREMTDVGTKRKAIRGSLSAISREELSSATHAGYKMLVDCNGIVVLSKSPLVFFSESGQECDIPGMVQAFEAITVKRQRELIGIPESTWTIVDLRWMRRELGEFLKDERKAGGKAAKSKHALPRREKPSE